MRTSTRADTLALLHRYRHRPLGVLGHAFFLTALRRCCGPTRRRTDRTSCSTTWC
jgi:hypothetical protein